MQARTPPALRNVSPVVHNHTPSRLSPKALVFVFPPPNMTASNLSPKVQPITVRPYPTGPPPMPALLPPMPALLPAALAPPMLQAPPPMPPLPAPPPMPPMQPMLPVLPPQPMPLSVLVLQSKHASQQYQISIDRAEQESRYIVAAWLEGIWRETNVEWAQPARVQWHAYMQSPSYAKWSTFVNK